MASNFGPDQRPRAYGLVAAAGAIAVAAGPLIGGAATTYFSWRYVFIGEVVIVLVILALSRRIAEAPVESHARLDLVGTALSVLGLGMAVFGILRSSEWGWVVAEVRGAVAPGHLAHVLVDRRRVCSSCGCSSAGSTAWSRGAASPLVRPDMLTNRQLDGGLVMFFFQYLLQAGVFFVVPLFLSVVLGLSRHRDRRPDHAAVDRAAGGRRGRPQALATGLTAARGAYRRPAHARRDPRPDGAGRPRRHRGGGRIPMLLVGLGIGALASQLGAVTVSAVPDEQSGEVGGLQNTATNLGASIGTALAGSVLIAVLTTSFIAGIQQNPHVPDDLKTEASVQLAAGRPFVSDSSARAGDEPRPARARPTDEDRRREPRRSHAGDGRRARGARVLAVVSLFFTNASPTSSPAPRTTCRVGQDADRPVPSRRDRPRDEVLDPAVAADAAKLAGIFRWLAESEFPGYSSLYEHLARHIADELWIPAFISRHCRSSFAGVLFFACVRDLTLAEPVLPLARRYAEIAAGADPLVPDPWPLFRELVVDRRDDLGRRARDPHRPDQRGRPVGRAAARVRRSVADASIGRCT